MRTFVVIKLPPLLNQYFCLAPGYELFPVQAFITQLAVKLSTNPFCQGLPGVI